MLFSSPLFLFAFLPALIGPYLLLGTRGRNLLLLAASLLFYAWGEGTYVAVMLAIIAVNYVLGARIGRLPADRSARPALTLAVVVNLGLLVAFKYSNFLANQVDAILGPAGLPAIGLAPVRLPLGISFFTFHAISYVVDVSRREVRAGGPLDFALYMTLFPHAIAGPIVRYGHVADQLRQRALTIEGFASGVRRFVVGLAKKMLVANTLAQAADQIFGAPTEGLTFAVAWLGVACYTLQIYFDFSGYSDMAIGLARMFGIDFLENFDYPYSARSVTEFWRRWHISLSTWFRDYLYIPLGGNRLGRRRTYANLLIVFALCGLWHGASWAFLAWGLFHGLFLVAERSDAGRALLDRLGPISRHAYTILVVMAGWVLFRAGSMAQALAFYRAMIGLGQGTRDWLYPALYVDNQVILALIAGVLGSVPIVPALARARGRWVGSTGGLVRGAFAIGDLAVLSILLLASAMLLAGGSYNPFIYFRF